MNLFHFQGLSFAGQHDTFLHVRTPTELLSALQRCWASLWTARAIEYRSRNGIPHNNVAIAVCVQAMVDARCAGVLFTADVITGARDSTTIDACFGLGEALVSGMVSPLFKHWFYDC